METFWTTRDDDKSKNDDDDDYTGDVDEKELCWGTM